MNIVEKAEIMLRKYVCDNCLGRQFGQLLSGYNNVHRGRLIRSMVAMSLDKEKLDWQERKLDFLNFTGFKFHFLEMDLQKHRAKILERKCYVCNDIFDKLEEYVDVIKKSLKGIEFNTFLIGTKIPYDLTSREERLWEAAGIDYCEPIKGEINRELGKLLEKKTKKKYDVRNPDVVILLYMDTKTVKIQINSVFIYGEYQKLRRGIPQTKWPSGKYKTSIEQIAAKPFMSALKAKGHKFHGFGREDIDARCLAWRPFVLEITEPKKRLDKKEMNKLAKKIGKEIRVRNPMLADIKKVREIKEGKGDKSYHALVKCEQAIDKKDLKKLSSLKTTIHQKTPERVLHRRANLTRKRKVLSIKAKYKSKKEFELFVKGEGGLYIKELISGDKGRTEPSVSSVLNKKCVCKDLDVVGIYIKK